MKHLPLYLDGREEPAPWEAIAPSAYDSACSDCVLGSDTRSGGPARTRCMGAEGYPGGLLVVGDYPGRDEDYTGRPFYGQSGRYIREQIDKHWTGPIAFDNAVRCAPGRNPVPDKAFVECAPYLKHTVDLIKPQRILAVGATAMRMLLGRKLKVLTNRRGFGFTSQGVPVFLLPNPVSALRNRFVREWFEEDVEFALTVDTPLPPWDVQLRLIETEADALAAEAEITASQVMVFDVETVGPMHDAAWFRIVSLAACSLWSDEAFVWPNTAIDDPRTRAPLVRLLSSPHVGKIGANVKYDMLSCRTDPRISTVVRPVTGDVRVWRKMIFSDADAHLDVMTHLVGMGGSKGEAKKHLEIAKSSLKRDKKKHGNAGVLPGVLPPAMQAWLRLGGPPEKFMYGMLPGDVLHRYNARDAVGTRRLTLDLKRKVNALPHVRHIWESVVGPAVSALEQVEAWGMPVSREAMDTLGTFLNVRLKQSLARIHGYKPGLDPAKDQDLRAWLYNPITKGGLGLKPKKLTPKKQEPAVDAESLEHLKDQHPAMADLLEWSKLDKLRGTYVDGMREHIAADGRIHPSLNLDGARSGRLSCSDPNLQNIPRAKGLTEAKMVKDCFRASPGSLLLQADYSQLELRVAAMLSGDERMLDIFKSGEDYHLRCAKIISQTAWGVHPDDVLPGGEYRSKAKNFVFGLLYGMTDGGLARRMECTKDEAARIRKAVLGSFPRLAQWIQECLAEARRTGWTYTWWDGKRARQRTLWQIAQQGDDDAGQRITAENSSFNTPCQGTASDFCLASVVGVVNWLLASGLPAKLVITVHDSIIIEVAKAALAEVARGVHRIMTGWNSDGVPLVVDMEAGSAWGSLVNYRYHALQATGLFDKRFTETQIVAPGVEAVLVRADKDAPQWLHRYEFDPIIVAEDDAVEWLRTAGHNDNVTHPWGAAA